MKPRGAVLRLFCLIVTHLAVAESLTLTYLEGKAQLQNGAMWTDVAIGDDLSMDSTVRLVAGSFLQFKGAGIEFTLGRAGTYALRDIVAARSWMSSPNVRDALKESLRRLTVGSAELQSIALGARGTNQSSQAKEGWVESEAEEYLLAVSEYYFLLGLGYRGEGESENAKKAFSEVIAISADSDLGRAAGELL